MGVNARNGRFTSENGRFAHRAAFRRLWSLLVLPSTFRISRWQLPACCSRFRYALASSCAPMRNPRGPSFTGTSPPRLLHRRKISKKSIPCITQKATGSFPLLQRTPGGFVLSLISDQHHGHIVDIRAGRAGDDQPIHRLEGMVGIVVLQHIVHLQLVLRQCCASAAAVLPST